MQPTHFRCSFHNELFLTKDYEKHCNEKHDGSLITVMMEEHRCPHGNLQDRDWLFCCDYENWGN